MKNIKNLHGNPNEQKEIRKISRDIFMGIPVFSKAHKNKKRYSKTDRRDNKVY